MQLSTEDGEKVNREGSASDVLSKIACGKGRRNQLGGQQNVP